MQGVICVALGEQGDLALRALSVYWQRPDMPPARGINVSEDDADLSQKVEEAIAQMKVDSGVDRVQVSIFTHLGSHLLNASFNWEAPTTVLFYVPDDIAAHSELLRAVINRHRRHDCSFTLVPCCQKNTDGERLTTDEQVFRMMAQGVAYRASMKVRTDGWVWLERCWTAELSGFAMVESMGLMTFGMQSVVYPELPLASVCKLDVTIQALAKVMFDNFNEEHSCYVNQERQFDARQEADRLLDEINLYPQKYFDGQDIEENVAWFEESLLADFRHGTYCFTDVFRIVEQAIELLRDKISEDESGRVTTAIQRLEAIHQHINEAGANMSQHINGILKEIHRNEDMLEHAKPVINTQWVYELETRLLYHREQTDEWASELRWHLSSEVKHFSELKPYTEFPSIKHFIDKYATEQSMEIHREFVKEMGMPDLLNSDYDKANLLDIIAFRTKQGESFNVDYYAHRLVEESGPLMPLEVNDPYNKIQPILILPKTETIEARRASTALKEQVKTLLAAKNNCKSPVSVETDECDTITLMQFITNYRLEPIKGYIPEEPEEPEAPEEPEEPETQEPESAEPAMQQSAPKYESNIVIDMPMDGAIPPPLYQLYIAVNGQTYGPYPNSMWIDLVAGGYLTRQSWVWMQGMANWESAGNVKVLEYLWK